MHVLLAMILLPNACHHKCALATAEVFCRKFLKKYHFVLIILSWSYMLPSLLMCCILWHISSVCWLPYTHLVVLCLWFILLLLSICIFSSTVWLILKYLINITVGLLCVVICTSTLTPPHRIQYCIAYMYIIHYNYRGVLIQWRFREFSILWGLEDD